MYANIVENFQNDITVNKKVNKNNKTELKNINMIL
jgi:hypothetical protein